MRERGGGGSEANVREEGRERKRKKDKGWLGERIMKGRRVREK